MITYLIIGVVVGIFAGRLCFKDTRDSALAGRTAVFSGLFWPLFLLIFWVDYPNGD